MGIYVGVNGVRRKISQPYVGVNGVRRTISKGFCGRYGGRYQFFGPLEDVASVEIRVSGAWIHDRSSSSVHSTSLSEISRYATVSISSNMLSVECGITGKEVQVYAHVYAVFADGHEVLIYYLTEEQPAYGASISWPVSYYISITSSTSDRVSGTRWNNCCGTDVRPGYFEDSDSGSVTLTTLTNCFVEVGSGIKSGSGWHYTQMSFGNIIIDGRNVPVRVISQLTP